MKPQTLDTIDWSTVELAPFPKNFYQAHPEVANMSKEDVDKFRSDAGIRVFGENPPNPVLDFDNIKFPPVVIQRMKDSGFTSPTAIQAQGWPIALSGQDMIGVAQTGSGKTLSFLLPSLLHIDAQKPLAYGDGPIALVLCPTRELCMQIYDECYKFTNNTGFKIAAVYGGTPNKNRQIYDLKRGVHMVIATPGRLIDLLSMGATNLKRVTYFVLDEADRMLDMGFEPQIKKIHSQIRPDRQTLFWSATWPIEVQSIASRFTKNPVKIVVGNGKLTANKDVEQIVEITSRDDRWSRTYDLLKENPRAIIFVNTKRYADEICFRLSRDGIRAAAIHGDKEQAQRNRTLAAFKDGSYQVLVATDVAARGIDVKDVELVINYDFPTNLEDYIHRIGRTGRAGRKGRSVTFFLESDESQKGMAKKFIYLLKDNGVAVPPQLQEIADNYGHERPWNFRAMGKRRSSGGYSNDRQSSFGRERDSSYGKRSSFGGDRGSRSSFGSRGF